MESTSTTSVEHFLNHYSSVQRHGDAERAKTSGMTEKTQSVPLARLRESPDNPRKLFGDMTDFARTIETQGILQPIVARTAEDGHLEVVMGHRRFRAAKSLGWKSVDVIVREYTKDAALSAMLVENAAREDVSPIELAEGYQNLVENHGLTVDQVAERVGVKRSTVYAALQLLKVPPPIRQAVLQGKLPADGARAIAGIEGERLQLAAFTKAMSLTRPGEKGPSSRVAIKVAQEFKTGARKAKGQTKHQREAKEHGAEVALRRRALERLRMRVAEDVEHRAHLSDNDLRLIVMADVETGPDVVREVFQRRGVHPERLNKVVGAQLRSLATEIAAAKLATLQDGEYATGAKVVARAYGQTLGELEKTAAAIDAAEGLFEKK